MRYAAPKTDDRVDILVIHLLCGVRIYGTCTVVIPTYNEEKNIAGMAECIRKLYPDFCIRFMDDNSSDRSKELIDGLGDPKTTIVVREENRGLTASVLQGIAECGTDYFMVIDCDFQHPPRALGPMYAKMQKGCDMCIGVRKNRFSLGFIRWTGSWAFSVFADMYLLSKGKRISKDVMSGIFAGRTDVFVPVIEKNISEMELPGWKVLLDLLKFGPGDLKISGTKYEFGERAGGESHISPRVVLSTFNQCGRIGKFAAKIYKKLKGMN